MKREFVTGTVDKLLSQFKANDSGNAPVLLMLGGLAGVAVGAQHPEAARHLIRFLAAPAAATIVRSTGMEPATAPSLKHN